MCRLLLLLVLTASVLYAEAEVVHLSEGATFQSIGVHYIRIVPNKSSRDVYYIRKNAVLSIKDDIRKPDSGVMQLETKNLKTFIIPKKYIKLTDILSIIDVQ